MSSRIKRFLCFCFVLLFLPYTGGYSNEVKKEQNIVAAINSGLTTLDPASLRLASEQYIACNLWEGLTRKNINGSIEAGIAKNWEISQDGLKYKFYLRENALWSDGETVTAYQFEYAWKRALNPSNNSPVVFMMYLIKNGEAYYKNKAKIDDVGVRALDDFTLEVTLENPAPYFLELLCYHTYYPVRPDIIEEDPDSWYRKPYKIVSNGPFCLNKLDYNNEIKALKNPYYWDKNNVKINSITFFSQRLDGNEVWSRYLEGSVDFGYVFPFGINIENEIAAKKNNIISDNALSTYYLCFNSQNKPFDNIKVREAFELALNKNRIVSERKRGEEVATGFVPSGIPDVLPGSDFRENGGEFMQKTFSDDNVEKAKKLLREAGYSDMKDFPTIVMLAKSLETVRYIEEDWERNLGVNVEVDVCKDELYAEKKDFKDFDVVANYWVADFADPINFLGFLANENAFKNIFPYKYYSLIEKSNYTAANNIRMGILHDAEKTLMNSYALIPLFYKNNLYYVKPYVKNVLVTPLAEVYFRNAYIEK